MIGLNEGSIQLPRQLAKAEVNSHSKKIVSSKAPNCLHFFNIHNVKNLILNNALDAQREKTNLPKANKKYTVERSHWRPKYWSYQS